MKKPRKMAERKEESNKKAQERIGKNMSNKDFSRKTMVSK